MKKIMLRFDQMPYAMLDPSAMKPDRERLIQRLISFMAAGMFASRSNFR